MDILITKDVFIQKYNSLHALTSSQRQKAANPQSFLKPQHLDLEPTASAFTIFFVKVD